MKDTLEKMLEAERQAEKIVSDADAQARNTLDDAHRRAADTVSDAREASHAEAQKIIDEAVQSAGDRKTQLLEEVRKKVESLPEHVPDERKQQAADLIAKAVLMQE
jgi:V/A-type H+-transporting ATPase subunit G/H